MSEPVTTTETPSTATPAPAPTPAYGPLTHIHDLPYSADELAGLLSRDESVSVNRLAASVLNLLTRTDQMLQNERMAAGEGADHGTGTRKITAKKS